MPRIALAIGFAAALAAALAPQPAKAQLFGGANVGTLGVGADLGFHITDFVGVRATGSYLQFDISRSLGGVNYDLDLNFVSAGGVIDFYPLALLPLGDGLRLSAGMRWNGNEVDFSTSTSTAVQIGGTTYAVGTRLDGNIEFGEVAGYAGIGYVFTPAPFIRVALDAGVLLQGAPNVTLRTTNPLVSAADLRAEEAQIEDDLKFLRYYPVITLSGFIRF
jgi:hypothetical protein